MLFSDPFGVRGRNRPEPAGDRDQCCEGLPERQNAGALAGSVERKDAKTPKTREARFTDDSRLIRRTRIKGRESLILAVKRAEDYPWGSLSRRVQGTSAAPPPLSESPAPMNRLWFEHVNQPQHVMKD